MNKPDINESNILRKRFLIVALLFSVAGAALAFYAALLTFKLTVKGLVEPGGCSFNDWLSCDTVLSTGSAKMFGAPVAWWGFLFYLWTFITILFALIKSKLPFGRACAEAVMFISVISIPITFFKIYQLITLKVICPVCVGMYISNFAIFIFVMKSLCLQLKKILSFEVSYFKSLFTKGSNEQTSHPLRFGVVFIWLFAMGYFGMRYYENTFVELSPSKLKLIVDEHFKPEVVTINVAGSPVTGNPEAKIKIVEFSDFECPSCKLLYSNLKSILLEFQNDVSLYFMNFPLDKSINENIKKEIHKNAGLAALAGVCMNEHGNFWNFQNELFENQTKLSRDYLIEIAESMGFDKDDFISCLESEETKKKVAGEIKTGHGLNITGTPALFINGRRVKYWNSPEVLRRIIEEEMKN